MAFLLKFTKSNNMARIKFNKIEFNNTQNFVKQLC